MVTNKTGTVIVSGARDLGSTDIAFGTAGDVTWSNELSIPLQVENAAAAPATQVCTDAREKFDAISVRVPFNGQFFDVAVPEETLGGSFENQTAIAGKIGGDIGSRELNRAVANYLLDREACALLAKEAAGTITDQERGRLKSHQAKWKEDQDAESRAKKAGNITDKEAALLQVYRDRRVRGSEGDLFVRVGQNIPDLNDGALVVCPSAPATTSLTTAKTPLELALDMVESYTFDKNTGVSTFTVPAGVTDVEAMKALNEYVRKHHQEFDRDVVDERDLGWFEILPKEFPTHCEQRDYSQARQITITGVVKGTQGEHRKTQERVLTDNSLGFSDPRDQAIAAALHACKHDGANLFKDLHDRDYEFRGFCVRGSVPMFVLGNHEYRGVYILWLTEGAESPFVAASGSPSPELKKT